METNHLVRLHAVAHPSAQVHRAGFGLDHPYIEQCWAPLLGPTSVLLLRRLPVLWQAHAHVEIEIGELARSLGLGASTGRHGSLQRTLDRLVRFHFAVSEGPLDLGVFTEAPPVPTRRLDRLPQWCQNRHAHLLGEHLDRLAQHHATPTNPTDVAARLDRLSQPNPTARPAPSLHR